MLRVTADSNIYVSAFNFGGQPRRLLQLAEGGKITLPISDVIVQEVIGVLRGRKFGHPENYIEDARDYMTRITERVYPAQTLDVVKADSDDNAILEMRCHGRFRLDRVRRLAPTPAWNIRQD